MKVTKLLGHPVTRESGHLSLADQIYDILRDEIHAGRWEIGEKLPSMMTMADQCEVSRMPVQQAIERLGEEGYLRQVNRSGVYLENASPEGRTPIGTIGLLLLADSANERELDYLAWEQKLVHQFMKRAETANYQTKIVYIRGDESHTDLNRAGQLFDNVTGIVSLFPFYRPPETKLEPDQIPLVFWCVPDHRCAPCIASDYEAAFYHQTRAIIAKGHRDIALVPCPILTPYTHHCYLCGYRKAMQEAGLEPDESLLAALEEIGLRDTAGLTRELKQSAREATCFLSMSHDRSEQLISALQSLNRAVPDDVSVVSANPPADHRMPNGKMLTGVGYSSEHEIDLCIRFLRRQGLEREWKFSTMLAAPFFVEGETFATRR